MKKTILTLIAVLALIAVVGVALVACTPKDLEAAEEKMEKAGYSCASYSFDAYEGCDGAFMASRGGAFSSDKLYALHFESNKKAKEAYNDMKDEDNKSENLKCNGKWVYYGSSEAIKAFEK